VYRIVPATYLERPTILGLSTDSGVPSGARS
jgi:hypothetical protein